jgi:hypothetical protein
MKTYFLLLFALVASPSIFAQGNIHLSSSLYPNVSWLQDAPSDGYESRPSVTAGLGVGYHFGTHFSVELGVAYANFGAHSEEVNALRWGSQHNGNGGFDPSLPGVDQRSTCRYEFIEIPLRLNYHSKEMGAWKWYASTGLSLSSYTHQRVEDSFTDLSNNVILNSTTTSEGSGFSAPLLSLMLAGGLERQVGSRLTLFGGPRLQWRAVDQQTFDTETEDFEGTYLQLGVEMGVRFR